MNKTLLLSVIVFAALSACTESTDPVERPEYIEQELPKAVEPRDEYTEKERDE